MSPPEAAQDGRATPRALRGLRAAGRGVLRDGRTDAERARPYGPPAEGTGAVGDRRTASGRRSRPAPGEAELRRAARAVTARHARTFALACRLLPRDVRDDVRLLYLVLRRLDDAVDEGAPDAARRVAAVEAWAHGSTSTAAADPLEVRVLGLLASRHDLPGDALLEFCAGMRHDLDGAVVRTEADLERYCHRVAGTVGVLIASVLGVSGDRATALRAAATLGRAMQRTNLLRDVDEDRAAGRVYLPADAIARHGGSLEPGARAALVREQIALADADYVAGMAGLKRLRRGRLAVRAAAAMYREILREIERRGPRAGRAVVGRRRKLAAALRAQTAR